MATLYKRGNAYYLNWRENGQQFRRSLGPVDRRQAEAIRAEKAAELAGVIVPSGRLTAGQVFADYLAWADLARPDSRRQMGYALAPMVAAIGHMPAEGLDPGVVERLAMSRGVGAATVHKSLRLAKAAFRRAMVRGTIRANPMERVSLPRLTVSREPEWIRREDLARLAAGPHGAVWAFMAWTGVRRGEMAKARRADVREGLLHVESTAEGRTKAGKWRVVPLVPQALAALEGLGEDRLVPVTADTLSDWFRADADAAGLRASLHALRHTFCTYLAQSGASAHDIKELAGHSQLSVTERYMHHAPGAGRAALDRMAAWAAS